MKSKPKPRPTPPPAQHDHPITYLGVQRVSARRWVHIGFDEATRTVVPMPKHLIPSDPDPKYPHE